MRLVKGTCCVAVGIGLIAGCANVKVKKVDVDRRLSGDDDHVKGFRYYLNRPYVVVAKRVPVSTTYVQVKAVKAIAGFKNHPGVTYPMFASRVPDRNGQIIIYSARGEVVHGLTNKHVTEEKQLAALTKSTTLARANPTPGSGLVDVPPVLARAAAIRVFGRLEVAMGTSGGAPDPEVFEALADDLTAVIRTIPPRGGEPLRDYGARAIPALLSAAKATTARRVDLGMGRAAFDASIDAMAGPLQAELFGPAGRPASRETVLARAVAVVAAEEVARHVDGLNPARKAAVTGRLADAAVRGAGAPGASADQVVAASLRLMQETATAAAQPLATAESAAVCGLTDAMVRQVLFDTDPQDAPPLTVPSQTPQTPSPTPPVAEAAGAEIPKAKAIEEPAASATVAGGQSAPARIAGSNGDGTAAVAGVPTGEGAAATDAFQVVFMPDFEEQYAIHNKNFLAKTKYQYKFQNGTALGAVSGTYNATDVPVKIIQTISTLIGAAADIATKRINTAPATRADAGAAGLPGGPALDKYYIKIEQVIEPGVYRIQKSWEKVAATPTDSIAHHELGGLFSEIGLPLLEVPSVLTAQEAQKEIDAKFKGVVTKDES